MSTTFSFDDSTLGTDTYLTQGQLTRSGPSGPSSAVSTGQAINTARDIDIISVTLVAGRSYLFDIDQGFGDVSGGSVDTQLTLINARGGFVLSDSGSTSLDAGSVSTRDPFVAVSVNATGTYYLAVHSEGMEYVSGQSRFIGSGGVGDYTLTVSTSSIPATTYLSANRDIRTYGDARQNIQALGGNDTVFLGAGADIATGGAGNDSLYGEVGDDELVGGTGVDRLSGGANRDVLIGGLDGDLLYGGTQDDALNGGGGNDALFGGDGNDNVLGNSGSDKLFGGTGNDFIRGGAGVDSLTGGLGADTFHFLRGDAPPDTNLSNGLTEDRILDFKSDDLIDLSDLFAGTLTYRGVGAAFTGAFQVRLLDLRRADGTGFQEVQVNLDGDRASEFSILVDYSGSFDLTRSDFLL